MAGISYENQVQKLIEQVEALQSIDKEKYRYFSGQLREALDVISDGDYTLILNLNAEIIDFLEDKIKIKQQSNLPVPKQKTPLINRLFKRKAEESEISKIADQVAIAEDETKKGQFIPDKRTAVYDFFKDNIKELREGAKQTIYYDGSEGQERTFKMKRDEFDLSEIKICESKIGFYNNSAFDEILYLARYDQFINSKTGDKTFINELGKEIEKASKGYDPKNINACYAAGNKLIKALNKNPVYKQTRKSFNKAYEEYLKTFNEFRISESDREKVFNSKNSFAERIKRGVEEPHAHAEEDTSVGRNVEQEDKPSRPKVNLSKEYYANKKAQGRD